MNYTIFDIPSFRLVAFSLILLIPILIDLYLDAKIIKETVISVIRMILQLIFVGFYLTYVFKLNNIYQFYMDFCNGCDCKQFSAKPCRT